MVKLFLPDGSDVAHTLLTRGLVQKSPTLLEGEEESPKFYPRKGGPCKPKPIKSRRSITETRLVPAARGKDYYFFKKKEIVVSHILISDILLNLAQYKLLNTCS